MRPGSAAAAIALATLAIRSAAGRDIVEVMAYVLLLFIPLSLALRLRALSAPSRESIANLFEPEKFGRAINLFSRGARGGLQGARP